MPEPALLAQRRGRLGLITLNRPGSINALNLEMVRLAQQALDQWRDDDRLATIAITGAGSRGLCAGGDVVALYRAALRQEWGVAADFLAEEYRLDADIARYPKPVVAVQHGVVLGGGIGISAHASHRIVTEHSRLGMPEVTIGVVPDVGSTWLLHRMPGRLGRYLSLTGETVGAPEAIAVGFSDAFLPAAKVPDLLRRLETMPAGEAIDLLAEPAGAAALLAEQHWIDEAFAAGSVPEILARLDGLPVEAARSTRATLEEKAPTALAVSLEALDRASGFARVEDSFNQEFRVAQRAFAWPDFAEGVRAQLIDKDRAPRWISARQVTTEVVDAFFAQLPAGELGL